MSAEIRTAHSGLLLAFEGIDGSGKSTQARWLVEHLRQRGHTVLFSCEPTRRRYGRMLRDLWSSGKRHDPERELELFRQDRRDHVEAVIAPALERGEIVILDRYYYSSAAYQGSRGGRSPGEIIALMTAFAPVPDRCYLFELPVDEALRRITAGRGEVPNVMERRGDLQRVQAVFASMEAPEILRVDATGDERAVFQQVLADVSTLLRE